MIQFDQVSLHYAADSPALSDISFNVSAGAFAFITGHSGAGKSSLLRLIARLEKPSSGHIVVDGTNFSQLKPRQEPKLRQGMGLVFQDNKLLNDRSVFDNVALPLIIGGYRFKDIKQRVAVALDRVGLSDKSGNTPLTLSGGEQQRVGIARAVVAKPRILLADEPTGNLDAEISTEIMQLLLQFASSGVTVLIATHDVGLLNTFNFPRIQLHHGRLVSTRNTETAPSAEMNNLHGAGEFPTREQADEVW